MEAVLTVCEKFQGDRVNWVRLSEQGMLLILTVAFIGKCERSNALRIFVCTFSYPCHNVDITYSVKMLMGYRFLRSVGT